MKRLAAALIAMFVTTPVSAHVCEDFIYDLVLIIKEERISCFMKMDDAGNVSRGRCSNGNIVTGTIEPIKEDGYTFTGNLVLRSQSKTFSRTIQGMYDRNDAWGIWEYRDAQGNVTRAVPFIGVVNSNKVCKEG